MKAVSDKILGIVPYMRRRVAMLHKEGGGGWFGVPPKKIVKIRLHLVVSGSVENDFKAKINNTLDKLDIVILTNLSIFLVSACRLGVMQLLECF